jgi:hypothetical protein
LRHEVRRGDQKDRGSANRVSLLWPKMCHDALSE